MPAKPKGPQPLKQLDHIGIYPGDVISLNLRAAPYFWIVRTTLEGSQEHVIRLDKDNYFAKIPLDASAVEMHTINASAAMGKIVKGKHRILSLDRDRNIKERYIAAIAALRGPRPSPEFKVLVKDLVQSGNKGGFSAKKILSDMRLKEEKGNNRAEVIDYLGSALEACKNSMFHYEAEDLGDTEEITISLSEVHSLVAKTAKEVKQATGVDYVRPKPTSEELLDAVWG